MSSPYYVTTAIPYVNGDPHVGFALECVQADVLARHRRRRGDDVRFLSGTDDNSLKNVEAAHAAGEDVAAFVAARTRRFAGLRATLSLSYDDFISTSVDARHAAGVERLWRACAEAGDLYERDYEGLYCTGCEAFLTGDELAAGRCPEHAAAPVTVAERNWFFRLSRYRDRLRDLIESNRLRIEPPQRRNEVLASLRGDLPDLSVSRSAARAGGWGIPVPGDPDQVVYVWFDALANYATALDLAHHGEPYQRWWRGEGQRVHVVGKGIVRFHAVYWPAILISAGEPVPTTIFVHDYLTVDGRKIAKSGDAGADPDAVAARHGVDALRWWLVRDVPLASDADFRDELVAGRAGELADGLGNLVNRTISLVRQSRPDGVTGASADRAGAGLEEALAALPAAIDAALERFDLRAGADAIWGVVTTANRYVSTTRPWELARAERAGEVSGGERLDVCLSLLWRACETVAAEIAPFLPDASVRIETALARLDPELGRRLFVKSPAID